MNPFVVVIMVLGAGVVILGICLYRLKKTNEKLADEVEKYKNMDAVLFTGMEKIIISKSLTCPQFIDRIREPKTKRHIRVAYKALLDKIKESIKQ